jgi:hypothetical protein
VSPTGSLFEFFETQLRHAGTGWSVGGFGAIAEFIRDPDEPVTFNGSGAALSAVTARGGMRISAHAGLRLHASESPTREAWSHRVALCLPHEICGMSGRRELTEIGPDAEALRAEDQGGILFDLGLGLLQVDACIRTADPAVAAALRRHAGKPVLTAPGAMEIILSANPHRVFVSRAGRAEVFQPIPPPGGKSPDGPHTHVLPRLLAHGRTHAATEPVPDGWVPCAHCHPPHPLRDERGQSRPFDAASHAAFQALLERYGDPARLALKKRLMAAVAAGCEPFAVAADGDRFSRATVRVALRQLQASASRSATLAAWLAMHDRASDAQDDEASGHQPPHFAIRADAT